MNKELLQKAIDRISQDDVKLGATSMFKDDGSPCCALGYMAEIAGISAQDHYMSGNGYERVREAYGIPAARPVWEANDDTNPKDRKNTVLALLKGWLEAEPN